jgi:hypothetical protein
MVGNYGCFRNLCRASRDATLRISEALVGDLISTAGALSVLDKQFPTDAGLP